MNAIASTSASPIAAPASCIISTSPAKPHSKLGGIVMPAITLATSAVTSPSGRSASSMLILAWRPRCSRSIAARTTSRVAAQIHAERRLRRRSLQEFRIRHRHLQQRNLLEPRAHVFLQLFEAARALVLLAGLDAQRRLQRAAFETDGRKNLPHFRHALHD